MGILSGLAKSTDHPSITYSLCRILCPPLICFYRLTMHDLDCSSSSSRTLAAPRTEHATFDNGPAFWEHADEEIGGETQIMAKPLQQDIVSKS